MIQPPYLYVSASGALLFMDLAQVGKARDCPIAAITGQVRRGAADDEARALVG